MSKTTTIDDLDAIAKELTDSIVEDVQRVRKEIPHPALSVKLTPAELWAKYGKDYLTMRENPDVWQQTIDEAGEEATLEFGRALEQAMMEEHYGQD